MSLFSRDFTFDEISNDLFDLYEAGELQVNDNHEFFRRDNAVNE